MSTEPADDESLFERIDYGIQLAVAKALAEHKRKGHSIFIWRDGKIVEIPPEEIEVQNIEELEEKLKGRISGQPH